MSIEVTHIIEQLCREKGIDKNILIDAVKTAVEAAARKKLPHLENL
ncbi:MAG: transcription termination/antitermination protein NusA, partial [Nitrospinae bacterium]|nr:transcription termination/antitermination protein NusA [Nitrospinota bacterium]